MQTLENDLSTLGAESRSYLGATHRLFIDGEFVDPVAGGRFSVTDPSSGLEIAKENR